MKKIFNKTFWLVVLALIGLGLSLKLCQIYHQANFVPNALPSFCAINEVINCDEVAQTKFAQFLGIPLALYGVLLYLFILFMCFVDKLQNIKLLSFLKVFKNKHAYIYTLYCFSFVISMILTFVQFVLIQRFCILCFMTYMVDFISIFVAKDYSLKFDEEFKISVLDFLDGIKVKSNLIAIIILAICAAGVLTYTKTSYILTPHIKKIEAFEKFQKMKGNPFKVSGNILGDINAKVIVYEYSDFECPICKVMNRIIQKASTEFDNVLFLHYNYPLDMDCNPIVTRPFHQNSCMYAKYAIAAKKQDKYWEMINLIFDKQPKDGRILRDLAQNKGFDINQLANDYISPETDYELRMEIISGIKKRFDATPTIYIDSQKYVGYLSYEDFKKVLIKHGATLKNKKN